MVLCRVVDDPARAGLGAKPHGTGTTLATRHPMAIPLRHVPHLPRAEAPGTPRAATLRSVRPDPPWKLWRERTRHSLAPAVAALRAGYGFAVVTVAAATATALGLGLGSEPGVFAPFLVAVTATALRHGIGPALLAIAAATAIAYVWFLGPLVALAFDPGSLRWLAVFRLGVFAVAGLVITWIAETHRQTLQQLERSRRQLRAFATDDDVLLQVIDHRGRITWADNGMAALLGYEPDEYVGQSFATFHADPALAAEVQTWLATGRTVENVHATLRRKDGATQDVLLNSNALLGDARTDGAGVLLAVLPLRAGPAGDGTKLAVAFLLERLRKAAAERQAAHATPPRGDHP